MAGLYGIILDNAQENKYYDCFTKEENTKYFTNELKNDYVFGRHVITKLDKDRFFYSDQDFVVAFEGVNYTKNISTPEEFIKQYKEDPNFINNIDGLFSCFIYDKKKKLINIYVDHLASKSLYYFYNKEIGFVFASEMKVIKKILDDHKIQTSVNTDGVYLLALYGTLMGNVTVVNEISRLEQGISLCYDINKKSIAETKWFSYKQPTKKISMPDAIEQLDSLMVNSIRNEWNKDLQYGKEHLSSISGGMDAKANVLIANELGFKSIHTLTFGANNSHDITISESMAKKYGFSHTSKILEGGNYLAEKDIYNKYIKATDGQSLFNGAAHLCSTVRSIDLSNYAVYHSGQIGDLVLSSSFIRNTNIYNKRKNIGYTGDVYDVSLLDKVSILKETLEKYDDNLKLYYYEQKISNGTLMGDRNISNMIDIVSPFYNKDLIEFTQTIPNEIINNGNLYYHWLKKKHPEVLKPKWDKINMSPSNYVLFKYAKYFVKVSNILKEKIGKSNDMNPTAIWMENNNKIKENIDYHFNKEFDHCKLENEVKKDLKDIYNNNLGNYANKFSVISTLYAVNKLFN